MARVVLLAREVDRLGESVSLRAQAARAEPRERPGRVADDVLRSRADERVADVDGVEGTLARFDLAVLLQHPFRDERALVERAADQGLRLDRRGELVVHVHERVLPVLDGAEAIRNAHHLEPLLLVARLANLVADAEECLRLVAAVARHRILGRLRTGHGRRDRHECHRADRGNSTHS